MVPRTFELSSWANSGRSGKLVEAVLTMAVFPAVESEVQADKKSADPSKHPQKANFIVYDLQLKVELPIYEWSGLWIKFSLFRCSEILLVP